MVDVDIAVEIMGRIVEVKGEDGLNPELGELARQKEAHETRRSPKFYNKEEIRSLRPPPHPSKTQKAAGMEGRATGGSHQGAPERMQVGSGDQPPSINHYSSMCTD